MRIQLGGRRVAKEQLDNVAELSELLRVTGLVILYSAGVSPGAGQTALYTFGPVPQLDAVQLDSEHGSECVYAGYQLAWMMWHFRSPHRAERGVPLCPHDWQKSSYSSEGNNCLELAVGADDAVLVRESEDPSIVVTAGSAATATKGWAWIMSMLGWQKSSYSGNASNCVELAKGANVSVVLRESDEPSAVIVTSPQALEGLLSAVRGDVIVR
ncbi:DUF397 domain-containing protein [Streptomyces rimosus]|uniref:DUF397 domain-containing protein n=1 Tax=Streptomyces rimosus TaxID=1927 RepID=UPI00131C184A|nr:DUF397 domain-containing protein [Streptomyces rimosus]